MMRGYEIMLEKRMEHFPQTRDKYELFEVRDMAKWVLDVIENGDMNK